MLLVEQHQIGMGEDLSYSTQEAAVTAAEGLGIAVPIGVYRTFPGELPTLSRTVPPDQERIKKQTPITIWEMYLLGYRLTKITALRSYVPAESCLRVEAVGPDGGEPMRWEEWLPPPEPQDPRFALENWFHAWAKRSGSTLVDTVYIDRTEDGDITGYLAIP
jgi:hypothetical protein